MKPDARPVDSAEAERLLQPLSKFERIGLAVSGGPDSMALMRLVAAWLERRPSPVPLIQVLTVDHGLREGSRAENQFVSDAAESLGLKPHILVWRGPKPKSSFQANARTARYRLLMAHSRKHDLQAIVTAHSEDDQAETLLMRLMRGSGIDGLAAMQPCTRAGDVALVRPLLSLSKVRLRATLAALGGTAIEDPSNLDARFERVRLRLARPALAAAGIEWGAVAASARRLHRGRDALEAVARSAFAVHARLHPAGFCMVGRRELAELPAEIALRVLGAAIAAVGCRREPVRLSRLETLFELAISSPCHGRTLGGCCVRDEEGTLLIVRETGRRGMEEIVLAPGESAIWDRRFEVKVASHAPGQVSVRALSKAEARRLRVEHAGLAGVPFDALMAVPSFWSGSDLVGIPALGLPCSLVAAAYGSAWRAPALDHAAWLDDDGIQRSS